MKKLFLVAGFVILTMAVVLPAVYAGMAPPEPTPVAVTLRRDMDFGDVAGDGSLTGTVVLNASTGAKTVTGGVIDFGGREQLAQFKITGDKNAGVSLDLLGRHEDAQERYITGM